MSDTSIFLKERLKRLGSETGERYLFDVHNMAVDEHRFVYDDGGMYEAGDKLPELAPRQRKVYQDNVAEYDHIRAIAIASGYGWAKIKKEYKQFEDENSWWGRIRKAKDGNSKRREKGLEHGQCVKAFIEEVLGWEWKPVMGIGTGVTMHCDKKELPRGSLILRCTKYYMASVDGVVHDTYDYTRDGTRAVYGYWRSKGFFTPESYKLITGEEL